MREARVRVTAISQCSTVVTAERCPASSSLSALYALCATMPDISDTITALPMEDELGIVYLIETPQQFWSGAFAPSQVGKGLFITRLSEQSWKMRCNCLLTTPLLCLSWILPLGGFYRLVPRIMVCSILCPRVCVPRCSRVSRTISPNPITARARVHQVVGL